MSRILIADDEEGFRFLLCRILTPLGHEVHEVGDGDAALAALRTFPANIALVDLFMPGREGIETIREIRQLHPGVRIVAMSGGSPKTGMSFLHVAAKLGAHRTLSKPFTAEELLAALKGLEAEPVREGADSVVEKPQ